MIYYILLSVSILISVTLHEFTKAYASYKLGDTHQKESGRLTLNPFSHFEPIGFLLFLFTMYGWGKPVSTSSLYYKDRRRGVILVYSLPILADFIFSAVCILIYGILSRANFSNLFTDIFLKFLITLALVSINLAVFNLIPIYPLCGEKLLTIFLNPNTAFKYSQYSKIVQILVVVLLIGGILTVPLNIVTNLISSLMIGILT